MTADELRVWALGNGWTMVGGFLSLTKPSNPKEAVVRMVLKATVVHVEAKKPAGKWEKLSGDTYAKVVADPETGVPGRAGLRQAAGLSRADAGEPGTGRCSRGGAGKRRFRQWARLHSPHQGASHQGDA